MAFLNFQQFPMTFPRTSWNIEYCENVLSHCRVFVTVINSSASRVPGILSQSFS